MSPDRRSPRRRAPAPASSSSGRSTARRASSDLPAQLRLARSTSTPARRVTVTASSTAATGEAVAPGKPIEVSVTTNATDLTTKPGLVGADAHPRRAAGLPDHGRPEQLDAVLHADRARGRRRAPRRWRRATTRSSATRCPTSSRSSTRSPRFADTLQQAFDAAQLGDDVEVWGVKPSDIAAQARKLKLLVDEMRGLADAVITCTPGTADPSCAACRSAAARSRATPGTATPRRRTCAGASSTPRPAPATWVGRRRRHHGRHRHERRPGPDRPG